MFLATTALSEFWEPSQDTLFLSAGCLRYEVRDGSQPLKYEVMECPWNDRQRFYDGAKYLDGCYERMLDQISRYLNTVLQVSHEDRYWRIIIGPWLFHFLHAAYDRYTLLSDAFSKYPELQTYTLDPACFRTPKDVAEFSAMVCYDKYNLQLFSELMIAMGYSFPARVLEYHQAPTSISSTIRNTVKSVARFGLNLVEGGLTRYLGRDARVYLCNMNLSWCQTWRIALKTKMLAIPLPVKNEWSFATPRAEFNQRRNGLGELHADAGFEAAFVQTLPQNFPSLYLEAYEAARADTVKRRPKAAPVLLSTTGWYSNEPFRFMAAEAAEKGSRLVPIQHGGTYGVGRWLPTEVFEFSISDSYMVWGWADKNDPVMRNLPVPVLSSLISSQHKKAKAAKEGPVVMVTTSHPRFLLRFQSMPVGGQWVDYFDWRHRFLQELPPQIRRTILLRAGEKDYGWGIRNRTLDVFPEIDPDEGRSYHQRLKNSRIIVADYPGTTYLEAMTANIPTVLFWDYERWETRKEAVPYFEELREVSILSDSPEAAAAHTASIFEDPSKWWDSQMVQNARRKFLDRFAIGSEDWVRCWAEALSDEAALNQTVDHQSTNN